jgi:glycosyltransferase involved in cell wall biosynthesis
MKILQIINSHALEDGGAQRLALEMHRRYLAQGHDSHLLSLMPSPVDEPNTYTLGSRSPYHPRVLVGLNRFLSQPEWQDVDLCHVHLFPAQVWAVVASRMGRIRAAMITTEHNTFNRRRGTLVGRLCDRLTLGRYRRIVCISPATSEALAHWQPQVGRNLVTIANGIDLTRYANSGNSNRDQKVPIILATGRISVQKNYESALRAIELLKDRQFEFWIAGKDELSGEMQKLAKELGVEDRVRFLGFQADIPSLLNQADIYLLTSRWEGFGLAVVEAMAAGLPVVCSDVPGVREVVRSQSGGSDGSTSGAFLVDPSSPQAIAQSLATLLDDPKLRRSMGERSREKAQEFDIERTVSHYLDLYHQVTGSALPVA